jgi:hypothetical protein
MGSRFTIQGDHSLSVSRHTNDEVFLSLSAVQCLQSLEIVSQLSVTSRFKDFGKMSRLAWLAFGNSMIGPNLMYAGKEGR